MNRKHVQTGLVFTALLVSGVLATGRPAAAQEAGCDSDKCHAKLLKGETVHAVAAMCESCHVAESTPHPKKGQKTFKLTQDPPALCHTCHEAFGKKSTGHRPVQSGMCTTCHNPHSSKEPKLLQQPMKELCKTCHADHVDLKVVHGPVAAGACTACHSPHESEYKKLLLKADQQELCFGCHLDMPEVLKKKVVHPALQGGCTSCHNPHGAEFPKLLSAEGPQLCFMCHSNIADIVNNAPVAHPAVATGCASCHSPHASDNAHLLLNPEKDTCLTCHPAILTDSMKVLHGPINEGRCTACHNPHGGQNPKLLARPFLDEPYVAYTGTEFAQCFTCHKRDMIQYPDTSFATNFRNGERNLHYLHVNNKQKGRSCVLCHTIHGSAGPALVAESVPFGKWNLPLKFVKTETGGSCAPGCHKPQAYDRKNPGKRPEVKAASQ